MAVWQAIEAAVGHRAERGKRRVFERVASGCRTVIYAALAYKALTTVTGSAKSAADQQQQATGTVLAHTGGQLLVGLVGLIICAVGIGLAIYGIKREFEKNLESGMSQTAHRAARWLGTIGYTAKGVAYAIVGGLVITAAVSYDPARSRGLDQALRTLAGQPFGRLMLVLVALGIAAFGIYCFFQARWRKI
jgi:ABC-type amino acid transport system permease subunit